LGVEKARASARLRARPLAQFATTAEGDVKGETLAPAVDEPRKRSSRKQDATKPGVISSARLSYLRAYLWAYLWAYLVVVAVTII
jgi:hypothetical protein